MPTCRGAERTGHAGSPCADDLGARKVGLWCSVEMVEFACERLQLAPSRSQRMTAATSAHEGRSGNVAIGTISTLLTLSRHRPS
jgi:hypothetical protein